MQRKKSKTPAVDMRLYEKHAYRRGFRLITGIDEVGRGPLAGPVVAAAVILPKGIRLPGLTDSKKLTPGRREEFCAKIRLRALAVGIGMADNTEIDSVNILQATFLAMKRAVDGLEINPDYLLIDGPYRLPLDIPQEGIVHGDSLSLSIAAASVIAKVHRDHLMCGYHAQFPEYGFDCHKGYATEQHWEAIRRYGPCRLHRVSFRGVAARPGGGDGPDTIP